MATTVMSQEMFPRLHNSHSQILQQQTLLTCTAWHATTAVMSQEMFPRLWSSKKVWCSLKICWRCVVKNWLCQT